MTQEQLILFKRSLNIYNTEIEAWTALDNLIHTQGQPVVAFFRRTSNTHGDTALGAIFAIGTANGVGKYKACSSHDDMLAVLQALNTHISEWTAFKTIFDKMFTYDAANNAIKANLDFYTDSNKNISAGGLGGSGSSSLGALYQLVDVMINSTGDGVEGAVEGSVLAYDATAGKWKAIAQSEILPDMSGYYTKEETDAAINAIPIYSMAKLSASDIASLSDGANVREAYRLKKGGNNVDDTVIKIYKDSAIKSLELRDNKYLVLTYTDNEGNEQSISKDLSVIVNDNYVDLINNQEIGGIKTFTEKTIFKKDINVAGDAVVGGEVVAIAGDAEPVGVTNYAQLQGKPSINGKELASGDNTLEALGIQPKGDYTTTSQLDTTLKNYATKVFVSNNYATKAAVNAIQALIPATATADNQLADKDFVNSSIATATAEFRGSFTSLDELKATSGNLNDYAFYLHTDNIGNKVVDRYKWTTAGWLYEYTLNNSSFTAEQWAAINSAITATLVNSYNSHLNNSTIHITATERTAWNNKWDYDEETIKAVKVNAAVLSDKATKLQTPRKIWGQYFDGSSDVSWNIHLGNGSDYEIGTGYGRTDTSRYNKIVFGCSSAGLQYYSGGWTSGNVIAHNFKVGVNSTTALAITNNGNVLIGTASDNEHKLQVNGNAYFVETIDLYEKNEATRLTQYVYQNIVRIYAYNDTEGTYRDLWLGNNRGTALVIKSNSNVLIGTTTDNGYKLDVNGRGHFSGDLICGGEVVAVAGEGTPVGVTDYSALTGKPSINGVTLVSGNNTLASLGIQAAGDYATNSGVTTLLANYADKTFVSNNYVGKSAFNSHTADTNIHITSAERTTWNAKWDYNENTIKAVKVNSALSADSVAWSGISDKPTSLKNPYALTFGSKTYDGSAAATITASDLGALTAHQSIYAFTLQVNGTSQGTYNPASAAKTINIAIPTKTSDITNDSGFITSASIPTALKNPYAVEIKANGVSLGTYDGSAAATFNLSAANVGAANKVHTHTASEISGLPTNLSSFNNDVGYITGITKSMVEGVLTGGITSHTHSYLPLSGGTITGTLIIKSNGSPLIEFKAGDITRGYYGFSGTGIAAIWDTKNWQTLLHSGNYNSYAPTLTGTGASGTWGINISGNASSATKLQTPRKIWGQYFDGSSDVSWNIHLGNGSDYEIGTGYGRTDTSRYNKIVFGCSSAGLQYYSGGWTSGNVIAHNFKVGVNSTTALAITNNGNVLIGTASDNGHKLQVNGNAYFVETIDLYEKNEATRLTQYVYQNIVRIYAYNDTEGTYRDLWLGNNRGTALVIKSNSNVLIGTTTDNGYKLQVNGSERVYGDLIVDGEVSALVA